MNVTVRGALRFKHKPALEKGIEAFDAHAYPELFKSELWRIDGVFAYCERTFEVEADCHYEDAFLAMGREAVEGSIDLRASDRKNEFTRVFKLGRPINRWTKMSLDDRYTPDKFGVQAERFTLEWAPAAEEARAAAAAKAAKEAAKKPPKAAFDVRVVDLPASATRVLALRDGTFAAACGSEVVFLSATGEITAEVSTEGPSEYDWFRMGISGLTELSDGRVVASAEHANELRVASRSPAAVEAWAADESRPDRLIGVVAKRAGVLAYTTRTVFAIDFPGGETREHTPFGPDDYIRGAAPWGDRLLVWTSSMTVALQPSGEELFRVEGEDPRELPGEQLLLRRSSGMAVVDGDGRDVRSFPTGDVAWQQDDRGVRHDYLLTGKEVLMATRWPHLVARWDASTAERVWMSARDLFACPPSAVVALGGGLIGVYSAPPFVRGKETAFALLDRASGATVARVDAKAPVLGLVALGEDGVAAWVEGRTPGNKVLVWRGLRGKPRLATLTGHEGRVKRVLATPDGRLVSWAADKTLRIWTLR